jgi:hypothetical protein
MDQKPKRGAHLLRSRADVERPSVDDDPVTASLVDAVVGADRIRMRLAEPVEPVLVAHLLVGDGDVHEISGRGESLARERGDRHRGGDRVPLHVESASTPEVAVAQLARPGVDRPFVRICEHRVRVAREHEAGAVTAAAQPGDEVGTVRLPGEQRTFEPRRLQVVAEEERSLRLVPGRIDRVDTEELLQEVDRLRP